MLDEIKEILENGNDEVKELSSLEIRRTKLIIAEICSEVFVKGILFAVSFFFIGALLFFLAMGAAFFLDRIFDVPGTGFFLIAALFVLTLFLFFHFRKKWVESPIVRIFINILFRNKTEDKI